MKGKVLVRVEYNHGRPPFPLQLRTGPHGFDWMCGKRGTLALYSWRRSSGLQPDRPRLTPSWSCGCCQLHCVQKTYLQVCKSRTQLLFWVQRKSESKAGSYGGQGCWHEVPRKKQKPRQKYTFSCVPPVCTSSRQAMAEVYTFSCTPPTHP